MVDNLLNSLREQYERELSEALGRVAHFRAQATPLSPAMRDSIRGRKPEELTPEQSRAQMDSMPLIVVRKTRYGLCAYAGDPPVLTPTPGRRLSTILAHATFTCPLCGDVAGTVVAAREHGNVFFVDERTQYIIEPEQVAALTKALAQSDARALFAIDHEYARFYCPECDAVFCKDHWDTREEDDGDGRYDCTKGTCPYGHTRIMEV